MVSKQLINEQLKRLGFSLNGWGRSEIRELPHILLPGEEIYELVNGTYEGGFALAVATDVRLLLVDKKPMNFLTVEDLRFDMINEIDYSHRLLGAHIRVTTGSKELIFHSYNKARLRKLIGHVQHSMADGKRQQSQSQAGQSQHLESISKQLRKYLKAQNDYQLQLQRAQIAQQAGMQGASTPEEPAPTSQLSDYLFARSLLAQYEAQTGKKLEPELLNDALIDAAPAIKETSALSTAQLHDLWAAGVHEIFGKHHHASQQATPQADEITQHQSFEINPVNVVFSKLPAVIRNRRFSRRMAQLAPHVTSAT
jgi:hypothetical protein